MTKKFDRAEHCKKIARLGGLATFACYGSSHMQAIGRKGAIAFHSRYKLSAIGFNDFAIICKDTGKPLARTLNGDNLYEVIT